MVWGPLESCIFRCVTCPLAPPNIAFTLLLKLTGEAAAAGIAGTQAGGSAAFPRGCLCVTADCDACCLAAGLDHCGPQLCSCSCADSTSHRIANACIRLGWALSPCSVDLVIRIPLLALIATPGAVYPATGPLDKAQGRMLTKPFGPATAWHLEFNTSRFTLVVSTAQGSYLLSKPSASYRKVFAGLEEQANLTWHVLQVCGLGWPFWPSCIESCCACEVTQRCMRIHTPAVFRACWKVTQ